MMAIQHGDYIEGFGVVTGLYHTATGTAYICWDGLKHNYYDVPFKG